MAICNPLLLLRNRKPSEELGASVRSWGNVEYAAEDVGDLESQQTEGHIREAGALFGEFCHVRSQVRVVNVEWLDFMLAKHNIHGFEEHTILVSNWASTMVGSQP